MTTLQPSDILREHGIRNARSCVRDLARHGWGFAPIDETPDLPDLIEGDSLEHPATAAHSVLVDSTRALIPEHVESSLLEEMDPSIVALLLHGRVNQTDRRVRVAVLVEPHTAAVLVSHLLRFIDVDTGWRDVLGDLVEQLDDARAHIARQTTDGDTP